MRVLSVDDVRHLPVGSIVFRSSGGRPDGFALVAIGEQRLTQIAILPERSDGEEPGGDPVEMWGEEFLLVHTGRGRLPTNATAHRIARDWWRSAQTNPRAKSIPIPASAMSAIETDILELAAEADAYGLDDEERVAYQAISASVRDGKLYVDPETCDVVARALNDLSNKFDDLVETGQSQDPRLDRAASRSLGTLAIKVGKTCRERAAKKASPSISTRIKRQKWPETGVTVFLYRGSERIGGVRAHEVLRFPDCESDERALRQRGLSPARLFVVDNADIDQEYRGAGYGKLMYEALFAALAQKHGLVFVAPYRCSLGSGTSPMAERVWQSLARKHTSSGTVLAIDPTRGNPEPPEPPPDADDEDFISWIDAISARKAKGVEKLRRRIEAAFARGEVFSTPNAFPRGGYTIVHRSTKGKRGVAYQVTWMDDDGPVGDTEPTSLQTAAERVWEDLSGPQRDAFVEADRSENPRMRRLAHRVARGGR